MINVYYAHILSDHTASANPRAWVGNAFRVIASSQLSLGLHLFLDLLGSSSYIHGSLAGQEL